VFPDHTRLEDFAIKMNEDFGAIWILRQHLEQLAFPHNITSFPS
jgi:hypothetical protein